MMIEAQALRCLVSPINRLQLQVVDFCERAHTFRALAHALEVDKEIHMWLANAIGQHY